MYGYLTSSKRLTNSINSGSTELAPAWPTSTSTTGEIMVTCDTFGDRHLGTMCISPQETLFPLVSTSSRAWPVDVAGGEDINGMAPSKKRVPMDARGCSTSCILPSLSAFQRVGAAPRRSICTLKGCCTSCLQPMERIVTSGSFIRLTWRSNR